MSWKLRCDLKISSVSSIVEYVRSCVNALAYVVEKIDTNPHIHFWFTCSEPPTRYKLRQLCGSGNGGYSLKKMDEEYPIEYLAYLHKEGSVVTEGIPQDILTQAVAYNAKVAADIAQKKKDKKSVWERIVEEYKIDRVIVKKTVNGLEERFLTLQDVRKFVLQYHLDNRLICRKFQMQSYVDTICLHYIPYYENEFWKEK